MLPDGYNESYTKNFLHNVSYQNDGKLQTDLSNFNSNDSSLVFNQQAINDGIKSNSNINTLRATNVPDQNIFNFSSINGNRNSSKIFI